MVTPLPLPRRSRIASTFAGIIDIPRATPAAGNVFEAVASKHGLNYDEVDGDAYGKPHPTAAPVHPPRPALDAAATAAMFVGPKKKGAKPGDRRLLETFVSAAARAAACPTAYFAAACSGHPTVAAQLREVGEWAAVARNHEKRMTECVGRGGARGRAQRRR